MSNEITWNYKGHLFKVGESLNNYPWEANNIYPIVYFQKKTYTGFIKPSYKGGIDRICLVDNYNSKNKPYWTTVDKVFNIIKLCQKEMK